MININEPEHPVEDINLDTVPNPLTQEPFERPRITFESITLSDGTTITLEPNDVVVLVGPNNAGKSLALRELQSYIGETPESKVIKSANVKPLGTSESFEQFVRNNALVRLQPHGNSLNIQLYGGNTIGIGSSDLGSMWPGQVSHFRPLFCLRIPTETRITDSDPANAIDPLTEIPSHPIHLLIDDRVEGRLSNYFRRAFGQDLILYRAGGRRSPLLVGERLVPGEKEDRISAPYLERLLSVTVPLDQQGDGMRSFASVILHLLAPGTPSILLLDEPEAFLHPPQARLLGEVIATERPENTQLFVATHSPDVLHGLITVAPERLRVVRVQRDGDVNRVKELDQEIIKGISLDPLMRYSSVLSGVFHERVIICEADADCMFYGSLLDIPDVHEGRYPDVLFVHANGKHRMAILARALVALDVPVQVVADMDVLNDLGVLQGIVEALRGSWHSIEPSARAVKEAVEHQGRWLTVDEVKESVKEVLDQSVGTDQPVDQLRREINAQFRKASPWEIIKSAGEQALPAGDATGHFRKLQCLCKELGLWIVPVGELEGFCKTIGRHGPSWVQQVIERLDIANAPELEAARKFVHEMWVSN